MTMNEPELYQAMNYAMNNIVPPFHDMVDFLRPRVTLDNVHLFDAESGFTMRKVEMLVDRYIDEARYGY